MRRRMLGGAPPPAPPPAAVDPDVAAFYADIPIITLDGHGRPASVDDCIARLTGINPSRVPIYTPEEIGGMTVNSVKSACIMYH